MGMTTLGSNSELTQFLKSSNVKLGFPLMHALLLTQLAALRLKSSSSKTKGLECFPCKIQKIHIIFAPVTNSFLIVFLSNK